MINPDKVKTFWETRSAKLGKLPFESIVNLEENINLLKLKTTLEKKRIMPLLPLTPQTELLDLGAGVGQWSFRFAPLVKRVIAVEYINSLVKIGRIEAKKRGLKNVKFINQSAENYRTNKRFDIIFISGLFVYLNFLQAQQLISNFSCLIKPQGFLLLRDGTSILNEAYYINNQYSDVLDEYYSAYYRTREQYISIFQHAGFILIQDDQMFEEGNLLNKFSETRLRYYLFSRVN